MMKKFCRIASLILVLALALSTIALAAENSKATVTVVEGLGAKAEFDTSNEEIVKVSVTSNSLVDGNQYLVLMVETYEDENGKRQYTIGDDTILYIDQTAAVGNTVSFDVYPKTYTDSFILITGVEDGALKVAIVDGKYILGDVNNDKEIDVRDVVRLANYIISENGEYSVVESAADVTADKEIDVRDVVRLANFIIGNGILG